MLAEVMMVAGVMGVIMGEVIMGEVIMVVEAMGVIMTVGEEGMAGMEMIMPVGGNGMDRVEMIMVAEGKGVSGLERIMSVGEEAMGVIIVVEGDQGRGAFIEEERDDLNEYHTII